MQQNLFGIDPKAESKAAVRGSIIQPQDLNSAQYEAVTVGDGPVLVIAGAGSGKTRTLVYRVACLLERGVPPERILLLTFTRKAAQEMIERASQLLDASCQRVLGGTFHAVANLLLRRHGHHLGFSPSFTILDRSDSEGIINLLKSSLNLGGAGKRFPSKKVIADIFSKSVNKSLSLEDLMDDYYGHLLEYFDDLALIRKHYQGFKADHDLMDYDDLLVNWRRLLAEFPAVQQEIAGRFSHILVDEYQDTNPIQADIVRQLAHGHDNVMVVGDDSQSIYSFRGADFRNIMEFPNRFPGCRIIRLEENYRSSESILAVTNAIIEKAAEKYTKTLFSRIEGGVKPVIFAARNESEQARYVLEKLMERHREGIPYHEMAVLFRSGFHSYKLELELANQQIDFEKRGGLKLTESAHIKDVLAYLRIVCNPKDNLSFNRILLQIEKLGPKTAQKLLEGIRSIEEPLEYLRSQAGGKGWGQGLLRLVDMLQDLLRPGRSPAQALAIVMEYYQEVLERLYHDDYPKRSRDLEQLAQIMAGYEHLQAFLDDTALDPPGENGAGGEERQAGRLVLSTIHSSKGLEWDTVFVINLADGKFPSAQATKPEEREEERRLLYVASTRAKRQLYFTYPRESMGHDRLTSIGTISPFLTELPPNLIQGGAASSLPLGYELPARSTGSFKKRVDPAAFEPGMTVKHPFFGPGRIESLAGARSVVVFFERHGSKTLHLDYAKLEIIG